MSDRIRTYILYLVGILFIGSIFWSIVAETLLPLLRAGDTRGFIFNLIGIPLTLLGTAGIAYGGYLLVRDTFRAYGDAELQAGVAVIRQKPSADQMQAARRRNLQLLWQAWRPGLVWLVGGFLFIAAGGFIINY